MKKVILILIVTILLTACVDNTPKTESWQSPSTLEVVSISPSRFAKDENIAEYTLLINTEFKFTKVLANKNYWHLGDRLVLVELNEFVKAKNYYLTHHKENGDER